MSPRLHHVGLLVEDLDASLAAGLWTLHGAVVEDPVQRARLCLVSLGEAGDGDALVELVQPLGEDSRVWAALQRGERQHHVCFQLDSRAAADRLIETAHMLPVTEWEPAVLFGGSPVRFAYTRSRELLEFYVDESA